MRSGKYSGKTERVDFSLKPGIANVFAVLPYKIQNLKFTIDSRRVSAGSVLHSEIELNSNTEKLSKHVVNVKVFGPDGSERKHYMQNVEVIEGVGEFLLKTAFNDKKGGWKIVARDVVSGREETKFFTLD